MHEPHTLNSHMRHTPLNHTHASRHVKAHIKYTHIQLFHTHVRTHIYTQFQRTQNGEIVSGATTGTVLDMN